MQTQQYANTTGLPLSLAVFLATDHYDHSNAGLSATALLKPVRQTVLTRRLPPEENITDVADLIPSSLGTAIHDGIERAWTGDVQATLKKLGYPQKIAERIRVNPPRDEPLEDGVIPVYLEQRLFREIDGVTISGKFDFLAEGRLEDFKSTSTFAWTNGTKDEDYVLQASIYRWLDPELITADTMAINFIFTDWMKARAMADRNYPQQRMVQKVYKLMSLQETEAFIRGKLRDLDRANQLPEEELPRCTDKELWRSAPKFKYYKNPDTAAKGGRSTKNFDNAHDAYKRLADDGHKGTVVEVPGQVKACLYCRAYPICSQKDDLIAEGALTP